MVEAWNRSPLLPLSLCNFCSSAPQPLISVWNLTETISALPTLAWELEHCASKLLKGKISLFTSQCQCFGAEGLVSALASLLSKSAGGSTAADLLWSWLLCMLPPLPFQTPVFGGGLLGWELLVHLLPAKVGFTCFRASACKFMLLIRHKERN